MDDDEFTEAHELDPKWRMPKEMIGTSRGGIHEVDDQTSCLGRRKHLVDSVPEINPVASQDIKMRQNCSVDFGPLASGQIWTEGRFSDNPPVSLGYPFSLECLNDGRVTLEEAFWGRAYSASKAVVLSDTD